MADKLHCERVVVKAFHNVSAGSRIAVGQGLSRFRQPADSALRPDGFAERTVRIEGPTANLLNDGIPADDLSSGQRNTIFGLNVE